MITIRNLLLMLIIITGLLIALPLDAYATPDIEIFPSYGGDFGTFIVEGGSAPSDTRKIWIKNAGDTNLTVSAISTPSEPFSIPDPPVAPCTAAPFTLTPGQETCIDILFSPTTVGSYSDKITVSSDDPDESSLDVPLNGMVAGEPFTISTLGEIKIMSNADTFNFGDLITSEIEGIGDTDGFKFTGKKDARVSITTGEHKDYNYCFVPRWEISGPTGPVCSDSNGGSGTCTLPVDGTYTILVGDGDAPQYYSTSGYRCTELTWMIAQDDTASASSVQAAVPWMTPPL